MVCSRKIYEGSARFQGSETKRAPKRRQSPGAHRDRDAWGARPPHREVAPTPRPEQGKGPAAPVVAVAPVEPSADPSGQLDLISWRPRPRPVPPPGTQLSLFGDDLMPEPKK